MGVHPQGSKKTRLPSSSHPEGMTGCPEDLSPALRILRAERKSFEKKNLGPFGHVWKNAGAGTLQWV